MSRNYQISYILQAIDKMTPVLKDILKSLDNLNKIAKKQSEQLNQLDNKRTENALKNANKRKAIFASEMAHKESREKLNKKISQRNFDDLLTNKAKRERTEWAREESTTLKRLRKRQNLEEAQADAIIKADLRAIRQKMVNQREAERTMARQNRQRRSDLGDVQTTARGAALAVSTPTAVNALLALRQSMTMEQLRINLHTKFGVESGNMLERELKKFARQTAFSYPETVSLISDLKMGQENLGIKTNEELLTLMKKIGHTLIAFSPNKENREEIVSQIGQVARSERASTRQDLKVIQKRGLPIFDALRSLTGMSFSKLQEKYGAEIPSRLVIAALEKLSESPDVLRSVNEQSKSLTQSWNTLVEQTEYTSAAYGDVLNKQFGIGQKMRSLADILGEIEDTLSGVNSKTGNISKNTHEGTKNLIGFGTALLIAGIPLTAMSLTWAKFALRVGGTAKLFQLLTPHLLRASGIVSTLYLTTVDWKSVMDDINEKGKMGALIDNFDKVLAAASALYLMLNLIKNHPIIATLTTIYAAKELGKNFGESESGQELLNQMAEGEGGAKGALAKAMMFIASGFDTQRINALTEKQPLNIIDSSIEEKNRRRMAEQELKINQTNIISINGKDVKIESKAKRAFDDAPVTYLMTD